MHLFPSSFCCITISRFKLPLELTGTAVVPNLPFFFSLRAKIEAFALVITLRALGRSKFTLLFFTAIENRSLRFYLLVLACPAVVPNLMVVDTSALERPTYVATVQICLLSVPDTRP